MSLTPSESPAEATRPLVQFTTIGSFNVSGLFLARRTDLPESAVYSTGMTPKYEGISTRQHGMDRRHQKRAEGTPRWFVSGGRLAGPPQWPLGVGIRVSWVSGFLISFFAYFPEHN